MKRKRVLLGDDHVLIIEGFRRLLEPYYDIVGEATDGQDLVRMAIQQRPDLVVTDIAMPLLNGIEAARRIRNDCIHTQILFVTMHSDLMYLSAAAAVGASGVLLKTSARQDLLVAVQEVFLGKWYETAGYGSKAAEPVLEEPNTTWATELSVREREVLQLITKGHSTKEMASILCVSPYTVSFHKQNVKKKLGKRRDAELVIQAIRQGLVEF